MTNNPYKIFVIVSEPRTGSTVLSGKLSLLDGVICQGEIFHPDKIHTGLSKDSIPSIEERNRNPIKFLSTMAEQIYIQKGHSELIGFKFFFDHNPTITNYILENRIPAVLLERKNKLEQYSSLKIANKTGKWHSKQKLSAEQEKENIKRGSKVKFSMLEFFAFSLRSQFRFRNLIKKIHKNNVPYYYTTYEDMFDPLEWGNILCFLDIDAENASVESTFKKQNKGSVFERFENKSYAKLCCKLVFKFPLLNHITNMTSEVIYNE